MVGTQANSDRPSPGGSNAPDVARRSDKDAGVSSAKPLSFPLSSGVSSIRSWLHLRRRRREPIARYPAPLPGSIPAVDTGPRSTLGERATVDWQDLSALRLCALSPTMRNRQILHAMLTRGENARDCLRRNRHCRGIVSHVAPNRWSSIAADTWRCPARTPRHRVRETAGRCLGRSGHGASIVSSPLRDTVRGFDIALELEYTDLTGINRNVARGPRPAGRPTD